MSSHQHWLKSVRTVRSARPTGGQPQHSLRTETVRDEASDGGGEGGEDGGVEGDDVKDLIN